MRKLPYLALVFACLTLTGCAVQPKPAHTEIIGGKSEVTNNEESRGASVTTVKVSPSPKTVTVKIIPQDPKEPK